MKIVFLFTGKTEEKWVQEGLTVFTERLKHYCTVEEEIIPAPKNAGKMQPEELKKQEGQQQLSKLQPGDRLVLLDEKGKTMNSEGLAQWIQKQQMGGYKRLVLLIGGPFGFSEEVYKRADEKLALSEMTFTHQMVRVILAEQVYRAFTILKGEKYHHK
ncbi:MAG: 23S rRNA (pseudouridine(1915)-N(3))-methyltransferase RlmH [Bacteroidia bacterium]